MTRRVASCALLALPFLASSEVEAQIVDNYDSGSMQAGWQLTSLNPALVQTSFVDANGGKAVRLQANPFPPSAPAVGGWFRDEVYTDFVVAVDLVEWQGTDKNQAFVLQGRGNIGANPATGASMIANYDTSQYGENPTDRRQGQFQINFVNPGFATLTVAAAEVTLQPGRSYRVIFKAVGPDYTAMIYDHEDFTKPLVTLQANDVTQASGNFTPFTSGKVGILGFSRQGTSGTVDMTYDNFYAGATDQDLDTSVALSHPVAGTPVVTERVPAERFKNFFDRSGNISFTAKTHNDNVIDAAATKLRLNGVDVSGQLTLSANGTTVTGTFPGSALAANTLYSAEIEVVDVAGTKRSKNTFWFDTFTDAFVSTEPVKTIEAEDFNIAGGEYIAEPIPVSGKNIAGEVVGGAGYYDQPGFNTQDFFDNNNDFDGGVSYATDYRNTFVTISQGTYPDLRGVNEPAGAPVRRSDNVRSKYAALNMIEYVVRGTQPDEWMNYTRTFADQNYKVYLRAGGLGATSAELHVVTGDPTQVEPQGTTKLGNFNIPNMLQRINYRYIPMVDDNGAAVTVPLSGLKTVRLWMKGTAGQDNNKVVLNYLMFVPQVAGTIALYSSADVAGGYTVDAGGTIDTGAKTVTIPIGATSRFFLLNGASQVRITGSSVQGSNLVLTYE